MTNSNPENVEFQNTEYEYVMKEYPTNPYQNTIRDQVETWAETNGWVCVFRAVTMGGTAAIYRKER